MLGYRAFFSVGDARGLTGLAQEDLDAWLRVKGLDADALHASWSHDVGRGATGTTLHHTSTDGSRTIRARVVEEQGPGHRWTTELTVHQSDEDGESWVWLDVLDARDGGVRLNAQPHLLVGPSEVDALVDAVAGGERRGFAFVSAAPPKVDLATWHGHITMLLHQTRGLASGYVLDSEATALFAAASGVEHAVVPGTMLTFHPQVVLGGPGADAAAPVERRSALEQETRRALSKLMASVSGHEQVTQGAVEALAALVGQRRDESASAPGQAAAIDQLQARIADLEQGIDRESALRREALKRCEDEQGERAIAEQHRAGAGASPALRPAALRRRRSGLAGGAPGPAARQRAGPRRL